MIKKSLYRSTFFGTTPSCKVRTGKPVSLSDHIQNRAPSSQKSDIASKSSATTTAIQPSSEPEPPTANPVLSPSISANYELNFANINSILLLNIQGFNPIAESCQKWRLNFLFNKTQEVHYPIIALMKTWLKPCIANAQIHLDSYYVFRGDRAQRDRVGTLLYI